MPSPRDPSSSPRGSGEGPDRTPEGGPYDWWQRGTELLERGDPGAAAVLLEHAVQAESASSATWEALGRARYDAGNFRGAVEAFGRLVDLSPGSHYGHFALGLSLTRVDRFEQGAEHLAMAATMRPDRPEYADRLRQARATLRARREAQEPREDRGA
jgi:predicted Zn-dependent protease